MSEEEAVEATLSVGAKIIENSEELHVMPLGGDKPGIHLQLVDFSQAQDADEDADWELDPSSDLGLKVTTAGLDPEVAIQLLKVAVEFLEEAEYEEI